jgi:hypothetical protein
MHERLEPAVVRTGATANATPGWPLAVWAAGALVFALLATANGGGYRYGTSDQAFYIPAVLRALDPGAFPRDGALIDVQARLMLIDEIVAWVMRATGISLELLYLLGYLLSLVLIWIGLACISSRVYRNRWAGLALAAAFTLRYRIPRTSANSFEPYFHPRMLAFGLGVIAIAALLWRRPWVAVVLVAAGAAIHVTTALWFAVLIGVALVYADVGLRRLAIVCAAAAVALVTWMTVAGPLRGAWTTMDPMWLQAVSTKDSLFPTDWPAWAWVANFAFLGLLWWAHLLRRRRNCASVEDSALVWGATALVAIFVVTLPAVAAGLSLLVQFQISRVFWLVAFLATVYAIAAAADAPARGGRYVTVVAAVLAVFSTVRAVYVTQFEHPERALFAVRIPESSWEDAMGWLAQEGLDTHVLADPGHAWKYGTSVRVAAGRDVLLEEVKDSAIAIYSREVGLRVVDRTNAIGDFSTMTAVRARDLARRYDLDYLVADVDLPLPVAYRNSQFRIYSLGPSAPEPATARR